MKITSYIPAALAACIAMVSCQDNPEKFDNKVYVLATDPVSTIFVKTKTTDAVGYVQAGMAKEEGGEISVTFGANPSKVADFNSIYGMNCEMLPGEYYNIAQPTSVIPAGGNKTDAVAVDFMNLQNLDMSKMYVLPVSIVASPIESLNSNTYYFIVREAAPVTVVANMKSNYAKYQTGMQATELDNMTQITVEGLLRPTAWNKPHPFISTFMGIEGGVLLRFGDAGIPDQHLQFAAPNGNVDDSSWAIPEGKWSFISVTYDSVTGEVTVYINGVKKATKVSDYRGTVNWNTASGDITDGPRGFYVGYSYDGARDFNGDMSELRVWNRILTQEEINAPLHFYQVAEDAPGLVAYWKFDEGAGDLIHDYANGYDLICDKVPEWVQVNLGGKEQ